MKIWRRNSWVRIKENVSASPLSFGDECLMMLFKIEAGGKVEVHQHPQAQYGVVIKGRGVFIVGGRYIEISEGDSYYIPPGEEHGFSALEDTQVIDIFIPPREDYMKYVRRADEDFSRK
ncbi:MAG: cupin domain-containing protein [Nitrososphaerota archaeon]